MMMVTVAMTMTVMTIYEQGDDIYIMMQCLCVCHEKSSLSTSEVSARGAKLAAR